MRILFIDVDGVLNSTRSFIAGQKTLHSWADLSTPQYLKINKSIIDPVAINLVNNLCRIADAKIVISSSHRNHFRDEKDPLESIKEYFKYLGLDGENIIGYTDDEKGIRGNQIERWIQANQPVTHYAI